jgi:type VI secretion system protein ImpC
MNQPQEKSSSPAPAKELEQDNVLDRLLDAYGATNSKERSGVAELIDEFVDRLGNKIDGTAMHEIDRLIADLDEQLSAQLSEVLHAPEFQELEGHWRGLHQLVTGSEVGESLKIKVLTCTKQELQADFADNAGYINQTALYKKVFDDGLGQYGAEPYGLLVGDFEFGKTANDMSLLKGIAAVASIAHAPFISAAASTLVGLKSYTQLLDPPDLAVLQESEAFAVWRSFRQSDDAKYVGLTLPHVLGRLPYDQDSLGAQSFRFNEAVTGKDHARYLWINSAYSMAGRITDAFAKHGWCAAIRGPQGGGKVENLPSHVFETDSGDTVQKCPTEIPLFESRGVELSKLGFIPLIVSKGSDFAAFFSTQSVFKPPKYTTDEANANAYLSAQLQYTLAMSRVAHIMAITMRDNVGSFASAKQVSHQLSDLLANYTLLDDSAPQERKAEKPFRKTEVVVSEVPGRPGAYQAQVFLRPHYQLDELTADLSLVAETPATKP